MAVATVTHSYDGPKWTVNDLIKNPTFVPNQIAKSVNDSNIADQLLRTGPSAAGGAVAYEETVVLYAGDVGKIVAEYAEYPMTTAPMRTRVTAQTTKRGLGFRFSEEMRTRNDVGRVQDETELVRNTLIAGKDSALITAVLGNTSVQSFAAASAATTDGWYATDATASKIKYDVSRAIYKIKSQNVSGAQYSEKLGYKPNTMIVHPQVSAMFIQNAEVASMFQPAGNPASNAGVTSFSGMYPQKFLTLDLFESWRCPADTVIVCQRKAMGFISTEWPLRGTPLKFDESTDSYTSYFKYRDLVVVDNPLAVCKITNIDGSGNVAW
jgi:hypothetical protein